MRAGTARVCIRTAAKTLFRACLCSKARPDAFFACGSARTLVRNDRSGAEGIEYRAALVISERRDRGQLQPQAGAP